MILHSKPRSKNVFVIQGTPSFEEIEHFLSNNVTNVSVHGVLTVMGVICRTRGYRGVWSIHTGADAKEAINSRNLVKQKISFFVSDITCEDEMTNAYIALRIMALRDA